MLRGLVPDVSASPLAQLYRLASFAITTAGFVWVIASLVEDVLR